MNGLWGLEVLLPIVRNVRLEHFSEVPNPPERLFRAHLSEFRAVRKARCPGTYTPLNIE